MNPEFRRSIEEYVRPLASGLDGVTHFGDVARVVAAAERIAGDRQDLDRDLLYLLAVFSGQEKWISKMGNASRTEILLKSRGVAGKTIRVLFKGLSRFETAPRTPEEEVVHDALLLERMGAYGVLRLVEEARRERADFPEIARSIEEAAAVPLRTDAAEALARPRRAAMLAFARSLRGEHEEFGSPSVV